MWDSNEVEWSLEIFDDASERLVDDIPLPSITEAEIREHLAIPEHAEAIDGLQVSREDLGWLATHLARPVRHDLQAHTAFIAVRTRSPD